MDKKTQILFNLNNFLLASSLSFDYVLKNKKQVSLGYLKRVTYIGLNIALKLGITGKELADLCSYCLSSNIALYISEDEKSLCEESSKLIENFEFLTKQQDVLLYQKEHFDGTGIFNKLGEEIPLFSQIIFLSSTLNEKFDFSSFNENTKQNAINFVIKNENILFSKKIVNIFLEVSSSIVFWLDLEDENDILMFIYNTLEDFTAPMNFENILKITQFISKLENPNTKLVDYVDLMSDYYGFDHKDKYTLKIAASICKIGKLVIKKELLEKKEPLTQNEIEKIKTYPYYTKKILSNIIGFNDIMQWAIKIQERLDASGYIYSLDAKSLSLKDRLLINLSIYDALRQDKTYRKKYSHKETIEIMTEEAKSGKIDESIVKNIDEILYNSNTL
ncbi:phosphohydrolase [Malaciobacter molluscorum LMG 25693]|uniref:C-di-GMP phosphodiesterase, class II (HD-GYP domain) n=1 Tax=Malaciobacter molluscorum LMG 25693 TaxID=870501 RepID=A0A2G1DJH1_9BACT|nr:HD domain-containing phosphohydrolase [Malaciobacter molluscorum]AXX91633.1 c-di-GMP phosphodiesterase, class II (HD-GYP domain) [Malaciobacter molluscorum LMG 25693]PHO18647.1 phosphohydrolase [Malaciobacter molluscorum LMG 25693]